MQFDTFKDLPRAAWSLEGGGGFPGSAWSMVTSDAQWSLYFSPGKIRCPYFITTAAETPPSSV